MIQCKRAYAPAKATDGRRILVDRLWPRGVSKVKLDAVWLKQIAPSSELRTWFGHQPGRWAEFQQRYRAELERRVGPARQRARDRRFTVLSAERV